MQPPGTVRYDFFADYLVCLKMKHPTTCHVTPWHIAAPDNFLHWLVLRGQHSSGTLFRSYSGWVLYGLYTNHLN